MNKSTNPYLRRALLIALVTAAVAVSYFGPTFAGYISGAVFGAYAGWIMYSQEDGTPPGTMPSRFALGAIAGAAMGAINHCSLFECAVLAVAVAIVGSLFPTLLHHL